MLRHRVTMWSTHQKAPKRQRGTEAQFSFSFIVHYPSLLPTIRGLGTGNAVEGGQKPRLNAAVPPGRRGGVAVNDVSDFICL